MNKIFNQVANELSSKTLSLACGFVSWNTGVDSVDFTTLRNEDRSLSCGTLSWNTGVDAVDFRTLQNEDRALACGTLSWNIGVDGNVALGELKQEDGVAAKADICFEF